jgi:hypothetical protein
MKKGYFKITNDLVVGCWVHISSIFKDFRPVHIEFRYWENDLWYFYGISDLFDEILEGEEVPEYKIEMTRDSDHVITYKFIKV